MKPWLIAVASFAAVIAVAVPVALRGTPPSIFAPNLEGLAAIRGIEEAIPLASGGLQAMDVDGDTYLGDDRPGTTFSKRSPQSPAKSTATYAIDGHVEGVVVGGGMSG